MRCPQRREWLELYTMQQIRFSIVVAAIGLTALAGCTQPSASSKAGVRPDALSAVTAIRSAGQQFDSSVEVHPLRDAAVDGLVQQAQRLETEQQPAQALGAVRKALTI